MGSERHKTLFNVLQVRRRNERDTPTVQNVLTELKLHRHWYYFYANEVFLHNLTPKQLPISQEEAVLSGCHQNPSKTVQSH